MRSVQLLHVLLLCTVSRCEKRSATYVGDIFIRMNGISIGGTVEYVDINNHRHEVRVFRGIPYAKPPTGANRFKPPVKEDIKYSFNATSFSHACMQGGVILNSTTEALSHQKMSENCLFLNIYTPKTTGVKAVMVFLHGGAWMFGSGMRYDGKAISGYGDIVFVTVNFRLGPFGYLSFEDAEARGNYGLMDQTMALQWVKENIHHFGGDPAAITLCGGSSGSMDVTLHALLQKKNGLRRVISESGSFITSSPVQKTFLKNPRKVAEVLAQKVGCNTTQTRFLDDVKLALTCLREKPATDILTASSFITSSNPHYEFLWTPTLDGKLIKETPANIFKKDPDAFQGFGTVDLLVGANSADGDIVYELNIRRGLLPSLGINPPDYYLSKNQLTTLIPKLFSEWPNSEGIAKAVLQEYISFGNMTGKEARDVLIDIFSDELFIMPAIATARTHARMTSTAKTYLYFFDYINSFSQSKFRPEKVGHRLELNSLLGPFVSDLSLPPIKTTWADDHVRLAMLTYWTNFAKFGNPNGDGSTANHLSRPTLPKWPEFATKNKEYMNIGANATFTAKRKLRAEKASFWLNYVPFLVDQACPIASTKDCVRCPSIMNQYIVGLRLTVAQAHAVIIGFAAALCVFGVLFLIFLIAFCKLKDKLGEKED